MKVLNELKKEIEQKERKLDELRKSFDKANDNNDVHSQGSIAQEISKTVLELESLEAFYERMNK